MMLKLLISESPLLILPTLATKIGLNESIFIQQLHFWIIRSKHVYDGQKWVYNSIKEWRKSNFPFWSERTIERIIKTLREKNIIIVGNYNKHPMDKTLWYRIDYTHEIFNSDIESLEQPPLYQNEPIEHENGGIEHENECSCRQVDGMSFRQNDGMDIDNLCIAIPETTHREHQESIPPTPQRGNGCAEKSATTEPANPFLETEIFTTFKCNGKESEREWVCTYDFIREHQECYPGVDIKAETLKARVWILDNPVKRKTKRGMPKFLNTWYMKANDSLKHAKQHNDYSYRKSLFATVEAQKGEL